MSSSSLIISKSFYSLIVVALYENLDGNDHKSFSISFSFEIISSIANDSLAMSHSLPLKSLIVSSSLICRFVNLAVRSSNLDSHTALVSSKATQRMSHVSLATSAMEIILN